MKLLKLASLLSILIFVACSEDEADEPFDCTDWNVAYTLLKVDVAAAKATYTGSPTNANCQAYADTLNEAISELQDLIDNDCIPTGSDADADATSTIAEWKSEELTASACAN